MNTNNDYSISKFFMEDLPSYAAYDGTRKIAHVWDGLKISMRKIIFTLQNKYSKDFVKTETLANVCAAYTNYLHGAANLGGVCDTMAQSFVGANNYPLITGNSGGFGTRIRPVCSANRYTRVSLSDITKHLFIDTDNKILEQQFFEGDYIEPKYFMPIFPVLFLNGSTGMSTAYAHNIFPRDPHEVISYIKKKLAGTERPRLELAPWFRGFTGTVRKNDTSGFYECVGVVERNNTTSYTIKELPIGMEYDKYIEHLDKLCDDKVIIDYDDKCDTKKDNILFEVKTTRDFTRKHEDVESLNKVFKLVKSLPENFTCIDENSRAKQFDTVQDILDNFIDIRLKFYKKRKDYLLKTMVDKLTQLASKYYFVKGIIDGSIIVNKRKKDNIIAQLEKIEKIKPIDGSYDYLLQMPIHSLTQEKLEELKKQIEEGKEEYKKTKETSIQDMWLADLKELQKCL